MISALALSESPPTGFHQVNDKVNHFAAFFVLSMLAHRSWPEKIFGWWAALPLLFYGLFIEICQHYIPSREFSLFDILADAAGIAAFALILTFIFQIREISNAKKP